MKERWIMIVPLVLISILAVGLARAQGPAPSTTPQASLDTRSLLGSTFTYQGQLKDGGGSPVSSTCDFTFGLWDAASGGAQVGGDSAVAGVTVADGYFAALVNAGGEFGPSAFTGEARWLQIAVQCTGDAGPVTLDPRQPLSAAPYALSLQPGATISGTVTGGSSLTVINNDSTGAGLFGYNSASSGNANGLLGSTESTEGSGVFGYASSSSGSTYGLSGRANSPDGSGVYGYNTAGSGNANGVFGRSESTEGSGVFGYASSSSGSTYGLSGRVDSPDGYGVYGYNTASSGYADGVYGRSESTEGAGVYGYAAASSGITAGVSGRTNSTNGSGVYGLNDSTGVFAPGVLGESFSGYGVHGYSQNGTGVGGLASSPSGYGVYGYNAAEDGNACGVYGSSESPSGYAGYFAGNVHVSGNLSKGGGSFKIDHPLDPAGQYLYHSFVESPDMMNVYNGNVVLDAAGTAWVELPEWFAAVNGGEEYNADFRYQLTCIGGYAPVYVAQKIQDNRFQIAGGTPGREVSWQVTGIRHDPWAEAHRIPVEQDKPADERGTYLYPELYGQPEELGLDYQRHQQWLEPTAPDTPDAVPE